MGWFQPWSRVLPMCDPVALDCLDVESAETGPNSEMMGCKTKTMSQNGANKLSQAKVEFDANSL